MPLQIRACATLVLNNENGAWCNDSTFRRPMAVTINSIDKKQTFNPNSTYPFIAKVNLVGYFEIKYAEAEFDCENYLA